MGGWRFWVGCVGAHTLSWLGGVRRALQHTHKRSTAVHSSIPLTCSGDIRETSAKPTMASSRSITPSLSLSNTRKAPATTAWTAAHGIMSTRNTHSHKQTHTHTRTHAARARPRSPPPLATTTQNNCRPRAVHPPTGISSAPTTAANEAWSAAKLSTLLRYRCNRRCTASGVRLWKYSSAAGTVARPDRLEALVPMLYERVCHSSRARRRTRARSRSD